MSGFLSLFLWVYTLMYRKRYFISVCITIGAVILLPLIPARPEQGKGWIEGQVKEDAGFNFAGFAPDPEIQYSYQGRTFTLASATMRKVNDFWVPAREILSQAQVMFIKLDDTSFTIIRDDGLPLTLKVGDTDVKYRTQSFLTIEQPPARYRGAFYLQLDALAKLLDREYTVDQAANTVTFLEEKFEEISTFTMPKPEVVVDETAPKPPVLLRPQDPRDILEEFLPAEYRPDVSLTVRHNLTYLLDKANNDRLRLTEWNISGRAFEYTVDGRFRINDERDGNKQRFKEDGEFLGFYKEDLWLKLFDNNYAVPKLRSQSQSYFGGEVHNFYGPLSSMFLYGEMDNTVTGPDNVGAVRYFGDLYVLREEYTDPHKMFRTAGSFIFVENDAELGKADTTDFYRRNLVFMTDNTVNLYEGLTVDYTHAFSDHQPDNKVNKWLWDDDYRFGIDYTHARFFYKTVYEHVGEQYTSVSVPSTYQDFEGWEFSTGYVPAKNWRLNADARITKNNVERDPMARTTHSRSMTLATSVSLPWRQAISSSYTLSETIDRGAQADATGTRTEDSRIDYSKNWGNMSVQLSYDHLSFSPFLSSITTGSWSDLFSVSVFDYYPELLGSYLRFYQSYRKTKTLAANSYTTEVFDTTLGGRYNMLRSLSINSDWRVTTTRRESWNFSDNAMMTLLFGGEFRESPVTTFNVDFTLTNWDLYKRKTMLPKNYTFLFRVRHSDTIESPEKWGKVEIFIYHDTNSNGKHDEGEPGLPDVRAYVANGRAQFTNEKGIALIDKVVPGKRKAKIDITSLPLELSVRGAPVQMITVESLKTTKLAFGAVKTGTVKGRVYIDMDGDGVFTLRKDKGVPNIRIYLEPGKKDTLTFSDGTYLFNYLYPEEYQACVDGVNVPSEFSLKTDEKIDVHVVGGDSHEGIDFAYKPRPIKVDVFE